MPSSSNHQRVLVSSSQSTNRAGGGGGGGGAGSYVQAAYRELTSPENASVVKSVAMFGVRGRPTRSPFLFYSTFLTCVREEKTFLDRYWMDHRA